MVDDASSENKDIIRVKIAKILDSLLRSTVQEVIAEFRLWALELRQLERWNI